MLAPPAQPRPRALSACTAVRPPLSISTLSTRTPSNAVTHSVQSPSARAFNAIFKHMRFHSRDSSASSSSSAPASPLALDPGSESSLWRLAREASAPVLLILLLFPITTAMVVVALSTLPITGSLPRTLGDLAQLSRELQGYASAGSVSLLHVLAVLAVTASWKHAWSVPGSVLLNILAGVLLNPVIATLYMTFLTSEGSVLSTLLAKPLAPLMAHLFPKALSLTAAALQGHAVVLGSVTEDGAARSPAWIRLSILRLIGVVPWSGINIAAGVCSLSIRDCFLGAFLGTLPWTAVTVQVGDILQTVAGSPTSTSTQQTISEVLASPSIIFKLVFLTLLSLGPILARSRLSALIGYDSGADRDASSAEKHDNARGRRWSAWMAQLPLRRSMSKARGSESEDEVIPLTEKDDYASPA
ncbi:hypothetical protein EXIGLDRAFT_663735 [Exidia glandulosa HHB12029]|uniref:VTT domain-containing protein n=1 Tax=Exidia glandulosa HHB12029 TaxID=1314781 RepID=A0A165QYP7_EXIGL|nr:hypothetical protein EXIGLDRAFT_663735 [Exidia glandulosa HHB12029]